jgi:hypothetical protein
MNLDSFLEGENYFAPLTASRCALELTQPSNLCESWPPSPEVKRPGRAADYSSPLGVKESNSRNYISTPPPRTSIWRGV